MSSSILTCISLLLLAVYSAQAASINPHDLWDEANYQHEELQRIVAQTRQTAYGQTSYLTSHVNAYSRNVTLNATVTVNEGASTVRRQLDNLQLLVNVLNRGECMEFRHEELETVTKDLIRDIQLCATHVRLEAIAILINVSAHVSEAQNEVNYLRQAIDACQAEDDTDCIIIVTGEILLAKDLWPRVILDETLRVLLLARSWELSFDTCADDMTGLIYSEGSRIINEIEQCLVAPPPDGSVLSE